MMNSRSTLVSVIALFFSLTANSAEHLVKKSDGSVGRYKLLPVHIDPLHSSVVEARKEVAVNSNLPASYQIPKASLPATRDQGSRGTCVYFATVGMIETYLIAKDPINKSTKVSEQCLVGLRNWEADEKSYIGDDKPIDYRPDPDGDYLDLVANTVTYYGVPLEGKYPQIKCKYTWAGASKATPLDKYESLFTSGATPAIGKGHEFEIDKAPTLEKIKALLVQNIPVEIATLVYQEHLSTSKWDYNGMINKPGTLAGAHAVILTGYRDSGSKTIFTFKNSWGNWGSGGYGTITSTLLKHSWKSDSEYDIAISFHD
jgi:hypothetical protein